MLRPRARITFASALVVACLPLLYADAQTSAAAQASASTAEGLTVAQVLTNVRRATGYERLKQLPRGFVVEETEGRGGRTLWLGARGEFRQEAKPTDNRPLGFDGRFAWQVDRTGLPAPMPQRLREKLLLPAWFRSGWWLDERAPLVFALLPAETDDKQVALSMRFTRGLVGAQVYVDRATWLPAKLVVEYERGPFTVTPHDYQEALGAQLPRRLVTNYRGSDSEVRVTSIELIPATNANAFAVAPLPADTTFDNTRPAELQVAQGAPFEGGAPGHYYVRPLVDGRDVGWFHFDTGADAMQIDARLADELKLPVLGKSQTRGADGRVQEVTIRQGQTFQLGRVTIKNPIFLASDLSDKNAPPGTKRAGYVGYPVLARTVIEVEGGGARIALYDPATYRLKRGKWQELSYIDLTPAVEARLEGDRRGLFQLDTGYVGTVTFYDKFIKDERLLEGREVKEETDTGAGGSYKVATGTIEWFELAGHRFARPRAIFRVSGLSREGGAGVVGREFLSVFKIVFNYPERRIAFVR
ncbi:MAG TPA: retropepsin-like aspartic protease [Pyrinomonadaceae bacterium]|jgi:hypothetical protein